MAAKLRASEIDGNRVGNVNRRCGSPQLLRIFMVNWTRNILILIIITVAISLPQTHAQTPPALSLTLIGQVGSQYVTPAGQTTELKLEIVNMAPPRILLLEGEAYLDPNLNGTWQLIHAESMGSFSLAYLESAIWTFDLAVPSDIRAANVTNGVPQADLLIRVHYQVVGGAQRADQREFLLGVPGATVQAPNNLIWFALGGIIVVVAMIVVYGVMKRRRRS